VAGEKEGVVYHRGVKRVLLAAAIFGLAACSSGGGAKPDGGGAAGGGAAGSSGAAGMEGGAAGGSDAQEDGRDAEAPCGDASMLQCAQVTLQSGNIFVCDDHLKAPICEEGTWRCPTATVQPSQCVCWSPHPPGCPFCTTTGWACADGDADALPDARADLAADVAPADARDAPRDLSPEAPRDASQDSCNVGCSVRSDFGSFCQPGQVQWTCLGLFDAATFNGACRDVGTHIQRYCCPESFLAMCH
jgi:hypothetical protein